MTPDEVLAAWDAEWSSMDANDLGEALRKALAQRDEARALARHHEERAAGYAGWMETREKERDETRAALEGALITARHFHWASKYGTADDFEVAENLLLKVLNKSASGDR